MEKWCFVAPLFTQFLGCIVDIFGWPVTVRNDDEERWAQRWTDLYLHFRGKRVKGGGGLVLDHLLSQFTLISAQGQTLDKNLHHGDRERMHNVHWTSHLMTFCWYLRRWDWNLCSTNIVWVLVLVTIFCTRKIPRQSSIECVCARWCQSFRICIEISPMLENHWIFTTSVSERKPSKSDKIWFILLRPDWTVSHQGLNWLVGVNDRLNSHICISQWQGPGLLVNCPIPNLLMLCFYKLAQAIIFPTLCWRCALWWWWKSWYVYCLVLNQPLEQLLIQLVLSLSKNYTVQLQIRELGCWYICPMPRKEQLDVGWLSGKGLRLNIS